MEDSSMFMQWALSTLQHEHPAPVPSSDDGDVHCSFSPLPAPKIGYSVSLNSMVPGEPPAREAHWAASSWSSGDTDSSGRGESVAAMEGGGLLPSQDSGTSYAAPPCSAGNPPVSWNFSSASPRPSKEAAPNSAAASGGRVVMDDDGDGVPQVVQESTPTRSTTARSSASPPSAPYVQNHIMAERKRREKINQRFIELSTVIPGLKKMDKATILSDATKYVKELQEKLKSQEDRSSNTGRHRKNGSAAVAKKRRITVPDVDEDGGSPPSCAAGGVPAATRGALPEIEATILGANVAVRIHCEDVKGSLVRLLAEVEELHLSIVHANAMPFMASTMNITIMAKVEEGFNSTTADDIVGRLWSVLNQRHST